MKEIGGIFVNLNLVMYCEIVGYPKNGNDDNCYVRVHFNGGGYYNTKDDYPNKQCAKSAILNLTK